MSGVLSPSQARRNLREHVASVNVPGASRMLEHTRSLPRSLRPAWVERRAKELTETYLPKRRKG